jgi:uncharacterized membrane protein YhaH (DUF805 family)
MLFLDPLFDGLLPGKEAYFFIKLGLMRGHCRGRAKPWCIIFVIPLVHSLYIIKPVMNFIIIIILILTGRLISDFATLTTYVTTTACLIILLRKRH